MDELGKQQQYVNNKLVLEQQAEAELDDKRRERKINILKRINLLISMQIIKIELKPWIQNGRQMEPPKGDLRERMMLEFSSLRAMKDRLDENYDVLVERIRDVGYDSHFLDFKFNREKEEAVEWFDNIADDVQQLEV